MAARIRKRHQDDVRAKIQASQIVNRLQKHVDGEIELTSTQVQAARILLDKSVSNAPTEIEQKTEMTGGLTHTHQVAPQLTKEEWLELHVGATARSAK